MKRDVLILGGGIAGMSAAHELTERGYNVTILEKKKKLPGGKARSIPIEGTESEGRKPLPGEHGFRFFPGFYKHIIDTMMRIPFRDNRNGVFDNLVDSPNIMLSRMGKTPIITLSRYPKSFQELFSIIKGLLAVHDTGLEPGEMKLITRKLWQLMTSCDERRNSQYEQTGWWEFTEASDHSEAYNTLFVAGLTRTLTAAKAETCNTKTNGNVLIQMLFDATRPGKSNDRILCGPTNEMWLFPWLDHLISKGVTYKFNQEITAIHCNENGITGVSSRIDGVEQVFTADYYCCALPVERIASLLKDSDLLRLDPSLENIITLANDVAWMNGIQFYLSKDVPINKGHIIMADTPWALTAISQPQFWKNIDLPKEYGKGDVKGIISIDVSDWDKPGLLQNKPARECTKKEVIQDVWHQLKLSLNSDAGEIIQDQDQLYVYLDEDLIFSDDVFSFNTKSNNPRMNEIAKYGSNKVTTNEEPLLINKKNTWHLRNESKTAIPNFFLCSDYIKTFTDLATMEGANEAARRAVNNILDAASDNNSKKCEIWPLIEPEWLLFHKWLDRRRFKKGKDWKYFSPWYAGLFNLILYILRKLKLY